VAANARALIVRWREGVLFDGVARERAPLVVDGDGRVAASPVELLLLAAATCTATDVVLILQKQRVALRSLEVAVEGTRRDAQPRRYTAIHFRWSVAGDGADENKARRAIDLSLEKYCSVVASLAPDIRITYDLTIL
jgi:putative redox protein